ncbi:MAG: dynamin family protein [Chlorobium sp.]
MDNLSLKQFVIKELNRLATFYSTEAAVHAMHGDSGFHTLSHPVIWVLSPDDKNGKQLVDDAKKYIEKQWSGLSPKFNIHNIINGYPSITTETCNQVWFFFHADRTETQSEPFQKWADVHHDFLRKIPPVIVKWYTKQQLSSVDASIFEDSEDPEKIAGHECLIMPLETPDVFFTDIDREEIKLLLGVLTLQAYRTVSPHSYKEHWHRRIKGLQEELRVIQINSTKTPNASDAFDSALHTVYQIHKAKSRWNDLCSKAEEVKELPECEPGSSWDSKEDAAVREAAKVSRDRIYTRHSRVATESENTGKKKNRMSAESTQNDSQSQNDGAFAEFQKLSDIIFKLSEELATSLDKRGESSKSLEIRKFVKNGSTSIQIILYGPFSSGKTTFINTLLSLKGNEVLPVKATPTTSTFNLIEYGEKESFQPSFHDTLGGTEGMQLVGKEIERNRVQIRCEEMEAFLAWMKDDMLEKKNLRVNILKRRPIQLNQKGPGFIEEEKNLQDTHLAVIRQFVHNKDKYADINNIIDLAVPVRVTGIAFKEKYQVRSFGELKELGPKAALMINNIHVCKHDKQLRYLTIVDTPGVDSCIPYHHTMSRSYIEQHPNSPVIYFINGKTAGGTTDTKSIEYLLDLSEKQVSHLGLQKRTFFLITKRDEILQKDHPEVISKVQDVIKSRKWTNPAIYLVDSLTAAQNPEDGDWVTFLNALQNFIRNHQTKYLYGITDNFKSMIESWIFEAAKRSEELDKSQEVRQKSSEQRTRFKERLKHFMSSDFNKRCNDMCKNGSLYMSGSMSLEESVNEAIKNLGEIEASAWLSDTLKELVSEMKGIVEDVVGSKSNWKGCINQNISKITDELAARINNFVTDTAAESDFGIIRVEILNIKIALTINSYGFVPVLWEPVIAAKDSSGNIDSNFWGWYDDDLLKYRENIISALRKANKDAQEKTDAEFKKICDDYRSQVDRAISILDDMSRTGLSSGVEEERKNIALKQKFYEEWKLRVDGAFPHEYKD